MVYFQVSFAHCKDGARMSTYVAAPSEDTALALFRQLMRDVQYHEEYQDATIDGPISANTFYLWGARVPFFRANSGTLLKH